MKDVLVSHSTERKEIKILKNELVKFFNKITKTGLKGFILTTKAEDDYIILTTEIDGRGETFCNVRFVNPDSIMNLIQSCIGKSRALSLPVSVEQIEDDIVKLSFVTEKTLSH